VLARSIQPCGRVRAPSLVGWLNLYYRVNSSGGQFLVVSLAATFSGVEPSLDCSQLLSICSATRQPAPKTIPEIRLHSPSLRSFLKLNFRDFFSFFMAIAERLRTI
jgi:hypothetical protein